MTDFTWHRRANNAIASGYVGKKNPDRFVKGVYPTHIVKGQGAHLIDVAGKKYLDFMGGQGTSVLGYGCEPITSALTERLGQGFSHSLASTLEVETAEKLKECFPFIDCVQFFKSEHKAVNRAKLLAKGKTGREPRMLEPGFHSHIILDAARISTRQDGEYLVFDERVSGFRMPKYSASGFYGIVPDLIVLGGAMASGMPLYAVGGKYDVMTTLDVYQDNQLFTGEALSLAAAKATMHQLQTRYNLEDLWRQAGLFQEGFNAIWSGISLQGMPTALTLNGEPQTIALFMQEACKAGMLFGARTYMTFPLMKEWKNSMSAIEAIISRIKMGQVTALEGEPPAMEQFRDKPEDFYVG